MVEIILTSKKVGPEDVDDLLPLTHDPDPKLRAGAVRALCPCHVKAHDERIWNRIFELAGDENAGVRRSVFHALRDGSPRALEAEVLAAFESFRDDSDKRIRRSARKLLAQYRRTGRVNIL